MNPTLFLCIATIGVSIWAFNDRQLIDKLILSPYSVVHRKEWYRVITHAFIHADWMHLIFNMIALWSFGKAIQYYFSELTSVPYLHFYLMYFLAIIISSVPDLMQQKNNISFLSLGASGAVSAVVFAAIFFDPWHMIFIFFIPCPGIIFGVVYLLYSNYMNKRGGDMINHNAHMYGAIFGFIYPLIIEPSSIFHFINQIMHPHFF